MVKIRKPVLLKIRANDCIFLITSKILKILTEDIESICGLGSELQIFTICSIKILNILEVIPTKKFETRKMLNPVLETQKKSAIKNILVYVADYKMIWLLAIFIASNRIFTEGICKLCDLIISDLIDEDYIKNHRQVRFRVLSLVYLESSLGLNLPLNN